MRNVIFICPWEPSGIKYVTLRNVDKQVWKHVNKIWVLVNFPSYLRSKEGKNIKLETP